MTKYNEKILQNLKDANCSNAIIEQFFKLAKQGKLLEQTKLLYSYKTQLLECLHKNQKNIDCLDFLIYRLEQELKNNTV